MASELVFINTSGPQDSKSEDKRKAVRSQAAKGPSQPSSSKSEPTRRRHRKLPYVEFELDVESEAFGSSSSPAKAESDSMDPGTPLDPDATEEDPKEESIDRHIGQMARVALGNMPGAGSTHPFVPYPDERFVPATLYHPSPTQVDLSMMMVDIPELGHPKAKEALPSIWFPLVIAEQAVLNVVVLTATPPYVSVHQTQCSRDVLLKLKEDAISSIKRGLQDPNLATSDHMIAAVAKMAAYEAGFVGNVEQYSVHMKGLTKMVELRGGLGSLGLDGLLARMLLWVDLNAAFILETKPYFSPTNAHPGYAIPRPVPGRLLGGS